jgi:hypothetical protein
MMPDANWDELYRLGGLAETAQKAGKMNRELWRSLMKEAIAASNGRPDLTEFLGKYARSAWTEELRKEEESGEAAA